MGLILTRNEGEEVLIGNNTLVTVVSIPFKRLELRITNQLTTKQVSHCLKKGESVQVAGGTIQVRRLTPLQAELFFDFPRNITVWRTELLLTSETQTGRAFGSYNQWSCE